VKIYEITIKPISGFGTPLKGDTIFGHLCWQIAQDTSLCRKSLDDILSDYSAKPFAVISSAFPLLYLDGKYYYALKTPDLPLRKLFSFPDEKKDSIGKRKEYKSQKWMMFPQDKPFESFKTLTYLNSKELVNKANSALTHETLKQLRFSDNMRYSISLSQAHNTINRITGGTGSGRFAPFTIEQSIYYPGTKLALFAGINEASITIDQLIEGLNRIGSFGFGKDASTGLGKFVVESNKEMDLAHLGSSSPNACYTLAPCVPEKSTYSEIFFTPFTRFGRHGDVLAKSANPFKNPVIMADEGAVLMPKGKEVWSKPYLGQAVVNVSKSEPKTVTQGYSLYLPVRLEE